MTDYSRPSFDALNARITADLSIVPPVLAEPLAAMWARACHSQHGHLDYIKAQCSPLTCDIDSLYDWAALYGVDRLLAVAASGSVLATGTPGTVVLADTLLRAANGFDYKVLLAVSLSDTLTAIAVRCVTAGKASNVAANAVLSLIDPIIGCNNNLSVSALGLSGGADDELVDAWRLRLFDEWQSVVRYGGRSGKPDDYRAWARAAHPSVSGALVQLHALGIGTVLVRPICNGLENRLPTQPVLDAIASYFLISAPAVADWRLSAPVVQYVDIVLHLGAAVDSVANRQAINELVADFILSLVAEQAVVAVSDINRLVLSITSDYVLVSPTLPIVADRGSVLVFSPVDFV